MIHTVNLDMTTHCDQRCPDCCCGIGINRDLQHHPWSYFEKAAEVLKGIHQVNLTGGEPTFHPLFATFVPRFKNLFECARLTMTTNGYGVLKYQEIIARHIDKVMFSDFHIRQSALVEIRRVVHTLVYDGGVNAGNFTPRARRGRSGTGCHRMSALSGTVAYADGKLWGCCVAPGVDGAVSMEPTSAWRESIEQAALPCATCWFSE